MFVILDSSLSEKRKNVAAAFPCDSGRVRMKKRQRAQWPGQLSVSQPQKNSMLNSFGSFVGLIHMENPTNPRAWQGCLRPEVKSRRWRARLLIL